MKKTQTAFVAYSGRDNFLSSLISDAVSRSNAKPITTRFESWEFNDVEGTSLISPIIEGIDDSCFVVADVTYLNLNVVYEIGFAIGKRKRVFLVRCTGIEGDKVLAKNAGIFDTLGYYEYQNGDDLFHRLTSYIEPHALQVDELLDRKSPVYIVEPPYRGDVETMIISRVKKARYRYRSFNPSEDTRLSAVDAIRQVGTSSGIIISLQPESVVGADANNVRAIFVAGLAHGLGKPTLILAPETLNVPLDIRDETRFYRHPDDIRAFIASLSLDITEYQQQVDPAQIKIGTQLQSLRIGDPTAENEMATLHSYYLSTDQYRRALQGDVNLVVGRKGSGKTALFIQLRDSVRSDKRNIVVDLKPEGYQLLKLKEDILSFLAEGSRQHLITAFWEYLLLLEVAYKLLEKDRNTYKHNHIITNLYLELEETYYIDNFSTEGDFSERLLMLSQRIVSEYKRLYGAEHLQKLSGEQVADLLYVHDLRALRDRISRYLEHKQTIWILFDNLDKGWSTHGVDEIDIIALSCLISAGRKIERDMRKGGRVLHCLVFVRNDVYEILMQNSADYGKEMRAVLDWTDRDLLREMLRLRLVSGLNKIATNTRLDQVMPLISISHYKGHEIVDYMIDHSLMRPRNLLKIFSHCRGFASNLNHKKIDDNDIEKGLNAYSQDLLLELDRELTDVFPLAKDLLYYFLDSKPELLKGELVKIINSSGIPKDDADKIIDFLLYFGVLGLRAENQDLYIYDVSYDPRKLEIRIERAGRDVRFSINPAFWPALDIKPSD